MGDGEISFASDCFKANSERVLHFSHCAENRDRIREGEKKAVSPTRVYNYIAEKNRRQVVS
jgi:hypothetical protein